MSGGALPPQGQQACSWPGNDREKDRGKQSDRCPFLEMRWTYTQAPRGPRGNKRREDKETLREATQVMEKTPGKQRHDRYGKS